MSRGDALYQSYKNYPTEGASTDSAVVGIAVHVVNQVYSFLTWSNKLT